MNQPEQHVHHHEAHGSADELAICPVMAIPVNKKEAKTNGLTRELNGKTLYLCCSTCANQFDANPKKYIGA